MHRRGFVAAIALAGVLTVLSCLPAGHSPGKAAASERDRSGPVEHKAVPSGRPFVGKPRPPIDVTLAPGTRLESGVPGTLVLEVRSAAGIENIELTLQGDEGLEVLGPARAMPALSAEASASLQAGGAQAAGELARFEITATPTSGGTRRLSGLVTFSVGGVAQAVPFNLAVEAGGPVTVPQARSRKPEREPVRDAGGELIDSMSAETTVR